MWNIIKKFLICGIYIYSSNEAPLLNENNNLAIEENAINEDNNTEIKKGVFLSFRVLNGIYFIFSLGIIALYLCNDFLKSIFDLPDFIMFFSLWILNLICNWFVRPAKKECSKKRVVCLFINFMYSILLIGGIVSGYFLDLINDCKLFTGAQDCHSIYTLFIFIISIILFLMTILKILL